MPIMTANVATQFIEDYFNKLIETLMGGICLGGIAIKHFLKTEMRSMSRL